MNREVELQVLDEFVDANYFPPSKNWPKYEFAYRCCCQWALSVIRDSFVKRASAPVLDILSDLYLEMEDAMAGSDECEVFDGSHPPAALIFAVGREMTEIVAGLYL